MSTASHATELAPPPAASAPGSAEILRVWLTPDQRSTQVSLDPKFKDPAAWGILLADLALHVAKAYSRAYATPEEVTLRRIWQTVDAERSAPTDAPREIRND